MPPLEVVLQQGLNGLMLGVMYALIAVGFTLFFGVLDVIHFSHGDIFMLGAFAGLSLFLLCQGLGIGPPVVALLLAFLGAMLLTGLCGVLAERACVKPLARSSPLMTLLATLSLGLVIREAILVFYPRGADPKPFPSALPGGGVNIGGVFVRHDSLVILAIAAAAMVAVDLLINRTRMGAAIRAVAQDAEAAQMMGVDLDRTIDLTFFIGSALASVAGILSGLYYGEIHFVMGVAGGVIGFSAAAIGGLGNVYGAILGGVVFGVLQTTAAAFIPRGSEFRDVVAFAVVMAFLVLRPTGILGERFVERV
jgi:branched-chain amino acid transport system permease protein